MGVAWHEHVLILVALGNEFIKERLYLCGDVHQLTASEELQINQHLVVARTTTVNLLAHIPQFGGEEHLYLRVNVLHPIFYNKLATLAHGIDILQFGKQLLQFVGLKQSDALKHRDMCHGTKHIILGQIEVHLAVATNGEALNLFVYLKILFPEFHVINYFS